MSEGGELEGGAGEGRQSPEGRELRARLEAQARQEGFVRVGVAAADALEPEGTRLEAWVREGRHGSMRWMQETLAVRRDPRHEGMLPGARSVVILVAPYARMATSIGPAPATVARYARGRDYHNVLRRPMRRLARLLREAGHGVRAAVDVLPVFERAWAERAGVGFVGKNCCVIVPGVGSHVFLAGLITTAELPLDAPMRQRCGRCTLCLDACPTQAFTGPRSLDARRCVSYLSIEHAGPIEPGLRAGMGGWFLGCDACQDVCPYNQTAPPEERETEAYAPHPRWTSARAVDYLSMDEARFAQLSEGSSLRRLGLDRAARNAALNLGNLGSEEDLEALERASLAHPSPEVRDAARWAIERIRARGR